MGKRQTNPDYPHQAVILATIKYEICERLPTGQVGTNIASAGKESAVFTVVGENLDDCTERCKKLVAKKLDALKGKTNEETQ
jgi:hypothetical protein